MNASSPSPELRPASRELRTVSEAPAASRELRTAGREPRRSLWSCERGAELVEFAFAFPLLLLVMLGIVDFGFMFQRYEVVTNAAREGARVAILPGYADADVQARVTQYLTAGGLTGTATVTVGAAQAVSVGSRCIAVRPVTVSYQNQFLFLGPILGLMGVVGGGGSLADKPLNATSSMRSEAPSGTCP